MSAGTALLLSVGLLLLNAFFVGAEFAVISARRSQIEPLAQAGRRSARTTLWAMEHVSLMLACAQLGITVASLGLGAVAEPALAGLVEPVLESARLPAGLVHPIALTLALTLVVYVHVVIGEMVPKNLAIAGPERVALVLAPVLVAMARSISPLLRLLSAVTGMLLRLLKVEPKEELASAFTAEEIHSIVAESRREGLLDDEHGLVTQALQLGGRRAGDVMVPPERLVTVPQGSTPTEVEELVARTGFSRFPVTARDVRRRGRLTPGDGSGEDPDGAPVIVGYLHLKDLLYADDERYDQPVPDKRVRSLTRVTPEEHLEDTLAAMQRSGSHLARVAGDGGATLGVVFLEDVLEELVGEVRDGTQLRKTQVKST